MYMNMGMQVMFDLAAPQPNYKTLIEEGGYVEAMPGMGLSLEATVVSPSFRQATWP